MRIACLGCGSLAWKWEPLRLASGWRDDGPWLPIEFARESDGGELATVLCAGAPPVRTVWAMLGETDLPTAVEHLRLREKIPAGRPNGIGSIPSLGDSSPYDALIQAWTEGQQLDAVIWTALPPRSNGVEGRIPSAQEALAYLAQLQGDTAAHAQDYIRRVPASISTPVRAAIEARFGWYRR